MPLIYNDIWYFRIEQNAFMRLKCLLGPRPEILPRPKMRFWGGSARRVFPASGCLSHQVPPPANPTVSVQRMWESLLAANDNGNPSPKAPRDKRLAGQTALRGCHAARLRTGAWMYLRHSEIADGLASSPGPKGTRAGAGVWQAQHELDAVR